MTWPPELYREWTLETADIGPAEFAVLLGDASPRTRVFEPMLAEISDVREVGPSRHLVLVVSWRGMEPVTAVDADEGERLCAKLGMHTIELASVESVERDHVLATTVSVGPRAGARSAMVGLGLFLAQHGIVDALCPRLRLPDAWITIEHEGGFPARAIVEPHVTELLSLPR